MNIVVALTHFLHKHFLWLLLSVYVVSVILPEPGLQLREISFGKVQLFGAEFKLSTSLLMLAFLLFNAGLGIKVAELKQVFRKSHIVLSAFAANTIIPLAVVFLLRGLVGLWHNNDELQSLLTGIALIVAMPIAGSSAAWCQNANGNLSLSIGLILLSTIFSPLLTPYTLHMFSLITSGDYSEDLQELADLGANAFMCLTVVLPSLAGIVLHFVLGEERTASFKPVFKLINFVFLLTLNYTNAVTSLPEAMRHPDYDFLIFILAAVIFMCFTTFGCGWVLSKLFKTDKADMAALMFGLGMNNNGTGLVLATTALADHHAVFLPMIFYTLVQQIIAAVVDKNLFQDDD